MCGRIDVLHFYIGRYVQADGRIIQDGFYASLYEFICHTLCSSGRDGQHGHLYPGGLDLFHDLFGVFDNEIADLLTDLRRRRKNETPGG